MAKKAKKAKKEGEEGQEGEEEVISARVELLSSARAPSRVDFGDGGPSSPF